MFVLKIRLFPISLLVCEFNPHRQTWYQTFMGTYPPLATVAQKHIIDSEAHWRPVNDPSRFWTSAEAGYREIERVMRSSQGCI